MRSLISTLAIVMSLGMAAGAYAAQSLPAVSHDGLHLQQDTKMRAVYLRPGVDLKEFDKVAILEAYVAFKKNWQRDYNREHMNLMQRIDDKDVKRIRDEVAKEFNRVFKEVLVDKGGHTLVDEGAAGVLIVRPAIINLDVAAPDTMTAGSTRAFSATAGEMTLYMELYDGKTGEIIARVIDPEAVGDHQFMEYRNKVTNRADADRTIKKWATLLNDHLAEIKG